NLTWPDACNTGILTRLTPSLDADILNQDAAVAIEALVRERFEERGYILVRIGLPPKRAILFRTLDPFDKIMVKFAETRSEVEKIEFLCDGQQLVAEGTHPKTGKPYSWFGGTPWEIAHDDLPYISREEAQQLVDDVAEMLCRDFGYVREQSTKTKRAKTNNGTRRRQRQLCHRCARARMCRRHQRQSRNAQRSAQQKRIQPWPVDHRRIA